MTLGMLEEMIGDEDNRQETGPGQLTGEEWDALLEWVEKAVSRP